MWENLSKGKLHQTNIEGGLINLYEQDVKNQRGDNCKLIYYRSFLYSHQYNVDTVKGKAHV